jgi:hypothetical protein
MKLRLKMEQSYNIIEIKDVLEKILKKTNFYFDFKIFRLKGKWINIVGKKLSEHTRPYKIYKDLLLIACDHQGFINSLQLYKDEIIRKIKKFTKEDKILINDVKFIFKQN